MSRQGLPIGRNKDANHNPLCRQVKDPDPFGVQQIESTMANTYTQIHIQALFAVQNRQSLIRDERYILNQLIDDVLFGFEHS